MPYCLSMIINYFFCTNMLKTLALLNSRFGRLKVAGRNPERTKSGSLRWDCICDCGKKTTVRGDYLTRGNISSCGCLQKERVKEANTTHGMYRTSEYAIWKAMAQRCSNPKHAQYYDNGGRGIIVCDRWKNSFQNFITDLGMRPSKGYRLKRIDADKNYEPNNCTWSISTERVNGKLKTKIQETNKMTSEWTKYFGNVSTT